MVVKPKIRNNICLSAHPEGCARQVHEQIEYIRSSEPVGGPKSALVKGGLSEYRKSLQ